MGQSQHKTPDRRSGDQRGQPKSARTDNQGRIFPSSDSLQQNRGGRGQRDAAKMAASARESMSATSKSSFDRKREAAEARGRGGGTGDRIAAAASGVVGSGDGGGSTTLKNRSPATLTPRQQQQRHRGIGDDPHVGTPLPSGANPNHPQRVGAATDNVDNGRDGSSTPASSSLSSSLSESNGLPYEENPVGLPVKGLADIDIAATMDGLLDREVRKIQSEAIYTGPVSVATVPAPKAASSSQLLILLRIQRLARVERDGVVSKILLFGGTIDSAGEEYRLSTSIHKCRCSPVTITHFRFRSAHAQQPTVPSGFHAWF